MSTKCTITCGPNFHLYNECFDDDNVYLELEGADVSYRVAPGRICMAIPWHIWLHIKKFGQPELKYADWTDEQCRAEAMEWVAYRNQKVAEAQGKPQAEFFKAIYFDLGNYNLPHEEQVENGYQAILKLREEQKGMLEKVKQIEERVNG